MSNTNKKLKKKQRCFDYWSVRFQLAGNVELVNPHLLKQILLVFDIQGALCFYFWMSCDSNFKDIWT